MKKKQLEQQQKSQIVIYKSANGEIKIDVRFDHGTVWLTQDAIANLYDKGRSTVTEHIQNVFQERELMENSVCREFRRTGTDKKEYLVKHYNLELIIAVGYRVKSPQGTAFRQWATARLKEYIVKGFVLDDERRIPMTMNDWIEKLHGFLKLNERDILRDAGRISHELMKEIAENKFDEYKKIEAKEDIDFDEVALKALESVSKRPKK